MFERRRWHAEYIKILVLLEKHFRTVIKYFAGHFDHFYSTFAFLHIVKPF